MLGGAVAQALQFGGINEVGLAGAELEGSPFLFQGIEAVAQALPEPVASVGRAEEAGYAAGGGEHGSDDIVPDAGGHEGGFVEDGEIEAGTAEFVGVMGGADGDHTAFWQIDAAFTVAYDDVFQVFDCVYQIGPDVVSRLIARDDPPAALVFQVCRFQDFDESHLRFAPAPPASQDFEARGAFEDFHLPGVGHVEGYRGRQIGFGCVVPFPFGPSGKDLHSCPLIVHCD